MDPNRLTNWPDIQKFVPTFHKDTYPFISPAHANLGGKSVFIVGASKGIGREIAISFAKAGCSRIAVASRTGLAELEQDILSATAAAGRPEPKVLLLTVDASKEADVDQAASSISKEFGGVLDALVNNAGRCEDKAPFAESRVDDYWSSWELNVKGPYLTMRAFMPLLLKSDTRTIINTSSAGAHMLLDYVSGYQSTKFALCRLNETVAKTYEAQGLVAIAIHPGDVLTDIVDGTPEEWLYVFDQKPELAGDTLAWLARERREWLSGRFLSVTWDMNELEGRKQDILQGDLLKFRLTI